MTDDFTFNAKAHLSLHIYLILSDEVLVLM